MSRSVVVQKRDFGIRLPDGDRYEAALWTGDSILARKVIGDRHMVVEMDHSGNVLHWTLIPNHWLGCMGFLFGLDEDFD